MTEPTERHSASVLELTDRRRPGRTNDVNPALIPLLRTAEATTPPAATVADEDFDEPHDLAAARGIGMALLLSIPMWVLARALVVVLLR